MKTTGIVFDIQRCSLHDGPGIRTTVFLKGCPLRCIWCHNPESVSFKPEMSYNTRKCKNCLQCMQLCPVGAHKERDGVHFFEPSTCIACGKCLEGCSYMALKIYGEQWLAENVIKEVEKDMDFYKNSGGGITLSGGEPMAQFEFTKEIFSMSKEKNINTCMETCGFASQDKYREILPITNTFLFDYKETNPIRHKELTGVTNDIILSNLDFLYKNGASIILRCPMVHGVNDSEEHLKGIAEISEKYPDLIGIELMAYHNMGVDKNLSLGKESCLIGLETTSEKIKTNWIEILRGFGCTKAVIG